MPLEQRHLRLFVVVAEELHFTRAAQRLGVPQPAVSTQIRRLEQELGVTLFLRTKRRVELTEAGRIFLEEARRGLAQLDWAVEAARRAERGTVGRLSIGFVGPATYSVLPSLLGDLHTRYPGIELDLVEMNSSQQLSALHDGRLHLGFLRPPPDVQGLAVEPVLSEAVLVALPKGHRLAGERRVELADLGGERLLLFRRDLEPTLFDAYMRLCAEAGITPNLLLGPNPLHLIISLVAAGLGFALVPASVRNLRRPDLAYRPLHPQPPRIVLAVAWRPDDPSPALRTFLEVIRERVSPSREA